MKRLLQVALLTSAAFSLVPSAFAADTYEFDKTHTNINWYVDHLGFSTMHGKFADLKGTFTLDEKNPEKSAVEITINTDSITTGNPEFDSHLKGDNFFKSNEFKEATFKSTKVVKTGAKTAKVTGNFTLLGVTKPVTLDVTLNKIGENPFSNKKTAGFTIKGKLDRTQFGMDYGVALGVGGNIDLQIGAEGALVK